MEYFNYKNNQLLNATKEALSHEDTIRVQRAIKNITQAELADLIQVSRQTINTIESGKYVP